MAAVCLAGAACKHENAVLMLQFADFHQPSNLHMNKYLSSQNRQQVLLDLCFDDAVNAGPF